MKPENPVKKLQTGKKFRPLRELTGVPPLRSEAASSRRRNVFRGPGLEESSGKFGYQSRKISRCHASLWSKKTSTSVRGTLWRWSQIIKGEFTIGRITTGVREPAGVACASSSVASFEFMNRSAPTVCSSISLFRTRRARCLLCNVQCWLFVRCSIEGS